jgi:hypothetical protein
MSLAPKTLIFPNFFVLANGYIAFPADQVRYISLPPSLFPNVCVQLMCVGM